MGGSQALQQVLFFGLLLFGLYFLAIRPQRSRARELGQVQAQLGVGSRVLTSSGISAVVTEIDEETAMLEISPGMTVNFLRSAIVRVLDDPDVSKSEPEPEPKPKPESGGPATGPA